ncbi:conserved hypothetical protein [Candidatus Phytoplasma solani]|nr:conserved hypothetical protein [Candidatus Phytoplasma solani]
MKKNNIENKISSFKGFKYKLGKDFYEVIQYYFETDSIFCIERRLKNVETLLKKTVYDFDTKNIDYISEFDRKTESLIKETFYNLYTKTIWFIKEYDKITHKLIKKTYYQDDGKTVNLVRDALFRRIGIIRID